MSIVLITGASSGMGFSIAEHLAALGHKVYGTSRKPDALLAPPKSVIMLALDINDTQSINTAVDQVISRDGQIDVLINNAGVGLCGAIEDTDLDELRWQMETNFFGPVRLIQKVLPHMRRQGKGRIITIGSIMGQVALPYQPFYVSSKFALEGFSDALRMELLGSAIEATIVQPGDFATGFTDARVFTANARSELHGKRLTEVVARYADDESNGSDPTLIAYLCERLIDSKQLRPRYSVGRFDQRFALIVKRIIPNAWFEKILRLAYHLD